MKRKNIIAMIIVMLTAFYAVSVFSVYQSEMNSTKGWYSYRVEHVYDKGKGDLKYFSDREYYEDFHKTFDIEYEEYDFKNAMSELTTNYDYEGDIPTVEVEAVFDARGNIIAREGKFYEKAVKYAETSEQTNDKQLKTLEKCLEECCSEEFDTDSTGVMWTTGENCNYVVHEFEYDSEKYFYFSGIGLNFVRATLQSETFVKAMLYISVCYIVLAGLSLILLREKKSTNTDTGDDSVC